MHILQQIILVTVALLLLAIVCYLGRKLYSAFRGWQMAREDARADIAEHLWWESMLAEQRLKEMQNDA